MKTEPNHNLLIKVLEYTVSSIETPTPTEETILYKQIKLLLWQYKNDHKRFSEMWLKKICYFEKERKKIL